MRIDLHTHTEYSSDSELPLEEAVRGWQRAGIDCVAVTDHNTIAGGLALREWAPLRVIVASEVRTCEGEIIGLFLQEEIARGQTPEETIRHIRDQNGLVMIPHPFDRFRRSRLTEEALMRILPQVDIVEVFNARTALGWDNHRAEKLASAHGLVAAVGSDSHTSRRSWAAPSLRWPTLIHRRRSSTRCAQDVWSRDGVLGSCTPPLAGQNCARGCVRYICRLGGIRCSPGVPKLAERRGAILQEDLGQG